MVNAPIDNTPVSETIGQGDTLTVPSGETWRVTITGNISNLQINGYPSHGWNGTATTVLTGGDTLSGDGNLNHVHVGGFKV